jgi:probable HAF family extracellular repeat protein
MLMVDIRDWGARLGTSGEGRLGLRHIRSLMSALTRSRRKDFIPRFPQLGLSKLLSLVFAFSLSTASTAEVRYDVIRLVEGNLTEAKGLNQRGHVVGTTNSLAGASSFWIWRDGELETHSLPYTGRPSAIDNLGRVVGSFQTGEIVYDDFGNWAPVYHAFLWENGTFTDLGTLGGWRSTATRINDDGTVIGWADGFEPDDFNQPFFWKNGAMRAIRRLIPSEEAKSWTFALTVPLPPHYIAGDGRIWSVGTYRGGEGHVYELKPEQDGSYSILDRGQIEGYRPIVDAFNELGQAVGKAVFYDFGEPMPSTEIFIWDEGGTRRLGNLGSNYIRAYAVNSFEQIVGVDGVLGAFLHEQGVMRNLNDLIPVESGVVLGTARAINDGGQILCSFYDPVANSHGSCLLIPKCPPPLELRGTRRTAQGLGFDVWGGAGKTMHVEYSSDLSAWTALGTSTNLFGRRAFLDPEDNSPGLRAYRAYVVEP